VYGGVPIFTLIAEEATMPVLQRLIDAYSFVYQKSQRGKKIALLW